VSPQPEENTFVELRLLDALAVVVGCVLWKRVAVRALALVEVVFLRAPPAGSPQLHGRAGWPARGKLA